MQNAKNRIEEAIKKLDQTKQETIEIVLWCSKLINYNFGQLANKNKYAKYKRGEIIYVNVGFNVGSELRGDHYALVLKDVGKHENTISVVYLTSKAKNTQNVPQYKLNNSLEQIQLENEKSDIDKEVNRIIVDLELLEEERISIGECVKETKIKNKKLRRKARFFAVANFIVPKKDKIVIKKQINEIIESLNDIDEDTIEQENRVDQMKKRDIELRGSILNYKIELEKKYAVLHKEKEENKITSYVNLKQLYTISKKRVMTKNNKSKKIYLSEEETRKIINLIIENTLQ